MESGNIVEYIDFQKIVCAVVLEIKNQRLRLLTESNREINVPIQRLSHKGKEQLDLSMSRNKMVNALREISNRRRALINNINIKELWKELKSGHEWIDLSTMTHFCYPDNPTSDHESAVIRAFFNNRMYFKFDHDRFFPNSDETVEKIEAKEKETVRLNKLIGEAGLWVKNAVNKNFKNNNLNGDTKEYAEILKSAYLWGKESKHYQTAKAILKKAGLEPDDELFRLFVSLGVFNEDENIDLLKMGVPVSFSNNISGRLVEIKSCPDKFLIRDKRKDLTSLPVITIDGQSTLDFDDAISIEDKGGFFRLGIHIADVAQYVKKGDVIDGEAIIRASSIYMPDQKIPMLPPVIAEDICSLKEGEIRPCISIMINIRPTADIIDYEIYPSLIRVNRQMTYYDANTCMDDNREIAILYDLARNFRRARLDSGAVYITVPDINVWVDDDRTITINKINRESPGRMMISEIMIMANWLMARFLAENRIPAVFRSQPDAKQRLYRGEEGSLFQNYMQRRLLSRFALGSVPERHSGLGLDCYVTATSPIRKYYDLVTQRQIRAVCGIDTPHTSEEINKIIQLVEQPMSNVLSLQAKRSRYWLLKYLESKTGQKEEAIVLAKRRRNYQILIPEYMIECELPSSSGIDLKPEDLIQVTIMHVNARKDVISVYMG